MPAHAATRGFPQQSAQRLVPLQGFPSTALTTLECPFMDCAPPTDFPFAFRGPMRRFRMGFHGRNQLFARYNVAASGGGEGVPPKHIKVQHTHSWAFYSVQFWI
jgi:hypothetical protein